MMLAADTLQVKLASLEASFITYFTFDCYHGDDVVVDLSIRSRRNHIDDRLDSHVADHSLVLPAEIF